MFVRSASVGKGAERAQEKARTRRAKGQPLEREGGIADCPLRVYRNGAHEKAASKVHPEKFHISAKRDVMKRATRRQQRERRAQCHPNFER